MLALTKKEKGFSLIELAVVLFIVSLLLGGLLIPLSTSIEQENRENSSQLVSETKEALLGFAIINGRLPCPDCPDAAIGTCNAVAATPNDGIEDFSNGPFDCRTDVGNVPWVNLQVDEDDAWGHHLTYQVSPLFSRDSNTASCGSPTVGVSFELCTEGDIDIWNAYSSPYGATPTVADNVIAVLISHGENYLETVQTDQEVENYGRNPVNPDTGNTILAAYTAADYDANVFLDMDYERGAGGSTIEYDDIVDWIPATILMNRMVSAGRLP